jgi:hypothetical protein
MSVTGGTTPRSSRDDRAVHGGGIEVATSPLPRIQLFGASSRPFTTQDEPYPSATELSPEEQLTLLTSLLDLPEDEAPDYASLSIASFDSLLYVEEKHLQVLFPSTPANSFSLPVKSFPLFAGM